MKKILLTILIIGMTTIGFAQDKPAKEAAPKTPIAITEDETKEMIKLVNEYSSVLKTQEEAVGVIRSAKNDTEIIGAAWKLQAVFNQVEKVGGTLNTFVEKLRSTYKCPKCTLDKDFKNLVAAPAS